MITTHNSSVTTSIVKNDNTIPYFDSIFASNQVEDGMIIKYPVSSAIFNIVSNTHLPNSNLCLKYDLVIFQEHTQDGYVMKSGYIDEESFGSTLEEAYIDFLTSIRDKYQSLQRRESKLSPRDKQILINIRSLLM